MLELLKQRTTFSLNNYCLWFLGDRGQMWAELDPSGRVSGSPHHSLLSFWCFDGKCQCALASCFVLSRVSLCTSPWPGTQDPPTTAFSGQGHRQAPATMPGCPLPSDVTCLPSSEHGFSRCAVCPSVPFYKDNFHRKTEGRTYRGSHRNLWLYYSGLRQVSQASRQDLVPCF